MNRAQPLVPNLRPKSTPKSLAKSIGVNAPGVDSIPTSEAERRLQSQDILRGAKAVVIQHLGSTYRLQATKQGKLILTK
jgi:hemin uptake protein HemP